MRVRGSSPMTEPIEAVSDAHRSLIADSGLPESLQFRIASAIASRDDVSDDDAADIVRAVQARYEETRGP